MQLKIFLDTVGCRLNQSEIETFGNLFRALGHEIVPDPKNADFAIINTCTVTVKAAADSRKQIRRAQREGARTVIATGCWATLEPQAALNLPGVTEVYANDQKDLLVAQLLNLDPETLSSLNFSREPLPGQRGRTRAFIKVQEGCDNQCTYCLTRAARGASRSRGLAAIHKDIHAALAGGVKEIVLSGVQLGAWGREFSMPQSLQDLIASILNHQQISRVRLSSIEPWEFDLKMLDLWQDARLCRHLHIPLQSGSDHILKKMGRPITVKAYSRLLDAIRIKIPQIAITTDIITGFPGETESDFDATKVQIAKFGFAGGHVFSYSPRPGTAAYRMDGRQPTPVVKARNAALRDQFIHTSRKFKEGLIGKTAHVLWEASQQNPDGSWQLSGLTDHYMRVSTRSDLDLRNTICLVELSSFELDGDGIAGRIIR
jgi:threonylcarbamoyladenosine tRNA methylthiotransferase MtaB